MNKALKISLAVILTVGVFTTLRAEIDPAEKVIPQVECFKKATGKWKGLGLQPAQAIELCAGTTDATTTTQCFEKAQASWTGLNLENDKAIALCKTK